MKYLYFLFFLLLLTGCRKNDDNTTNDNCLKECNPENPNTGFVCDNNTGECICPEGNFIYLDYYFECRPKNDTIYYPVATNEPCLCFDNINAIWLEAPYAGAPLGIQFNANSEAAFGFNLLWFIRHPSPIFPSNMEGYDYTIMETVEYPGEESFLKGYLRLSNSCLFQDSLKIDAHLYFNITSKEIDLRVDLREASGVLGYPVWYLETLDLYKTCHLKYVR